MFDADRGYVSILHALLEAGAALNSEDFVSVLERRIQSSDLFSVSPFTQHGYSALMWASFRGHDVIVHDLIDAGANIDIRSNVSSQRGYYVF